MEKFENFPVFQPDLPANVSLQANYQDNLGRIFVLSFNFIFGPPLHGYVLWLLVTGKRIESEFLNLNVSVCEIIISLSALLSLLEITFLELSAWSKFSIGLLTTGRALFQSLICVERYLAVVHPVTFLKYKPLRYKVICCTAAWIISLGFCVFTMFTVVSHDDVYMYCLMLQFFIFLMINMFCCVAVLKVLKQSGPGERGREREEENHMKRRAFYLILITTISTVILFLPTIITGGLYMFFNLNVSSLVGFMCLILSGFVQPVLYLHRTGKLHFCLNCSNGIAKKH